LKQLGVDITDLPPRVRAGIEAQHEGMNQMERFCIGQDYWSPVPRVMGEHTESG
jgi:hypothetical protein